MFGRNELVVKRSGDARCGFKHADQFRREVELEARRYRSGTGCALDRFENGVGEVRNVDVDLLEHRHDHGFFLREECGKEMQGGNLIVSALHGELMRPVDGFFCFGCVVVERCHIYVATSTSGFSIAKRVSKSKRPISASRDATEGTREFFLYRCRNKKRGG